MAIRVRNIITTSDNNCICGTSLQHWMNACNSNSGLCTERVCRNLATEGALVMKTDSIDKKTYVIPMCKSHSALMSKDIEVMDITEFVSANGNETCNRFG